MAVSPALIEEVKLILGSPRLPLYWSEKELHDYQIRSISSLRRDRVFGGGIPYSKFKGQIKYSVVDVLEWVQNHRKKHTA